jgi:hypothetical protein
MQIQNTKYLLIRKHHIFPPSSKTYLFFPVSPHSIYITTGSEGLPPYLLFNSTSGCQKSNLGQKSCRQSPSSTQALQPADHQIET